MVSTSILKKRRIENSLSTLFLFCLYDYLYPLPNLINMKIDWKKIVPHLLAIGIFLSVSFAYFYPALQGYVLKTHDIKMFKGMSKEIADHRAETGEDLLWTNSMFRNAFYSYFSSI